MAHFEDPKKNTPAIYRFMKTPPLARVQPEILRVENPPPQAEYPKRLRQHALFRASFPVRLTD